MLELKRLRDAPALVKDALLRRGWQDTRVVDEVLALDKQHRAHLTARQSLQARQNRAAQAIGRLMRQKDTNAAQAHIREQSRLKQEIKAADADLDRMQAALDALLLSIPNVPDASVPAGRAAKDNVVVHERGHRPQFAFKPQQHWVLTQTHQLVDFARGAKVAGAGFPFFVGDGARLQRALVQYFLASAQSAGYLEVQPPLVVGEASAHGTGQLPDKEGQMYRLLEDNLYLIPTAEVPLTNLYRGEILAETRLPIRLCGYTPCFRREAGSYGKDVRGLNRLHQFDKVEIVQITRPEDSGTVLEQMVQHAEVLLEQLELPYRRLLMCTGEMGFNQTKQYDLEVWSGGQARWLEVSSVSNFKAFQAHRLRLRYRPASGGKPRLAHTLNGSALALPRIVAALLENNQRADGTIQLPSILSRHAGMDGDWVIGAQAVRDRRV